jgi:hypothetical protein
MLHCGAPVTDASDGVTGAHRHTSIMAVGPDARWAAQALDMQTPSHGKCTFVFYAAWKSAPAPPPL